MSLGPEDVYKIAHLARLQIEPEQVDHYAQNLSKILSLVGQMDQIDTSEVTPMAHPHHAVARLRDDVVTESDQRDHFQAHAPATADGLYLVPKVVE